MKRAMPNGLTWHTAIKQLGKPTRRLSRIQNLCAVKCQDCGTVFQAARSHALYCSAKCRMRALRERNPLQI